MTLKELRKVYVLNKFKMPVKAGKVKKMACAYFVLFNKKAKVLSKADAKKLANGIAKKSNNELEVVFARYETYGVGKSRKMTFATFKVLPNEVNAVFVLPKKHHRAMRKALNEVSLSNKDYQCC